MSLDPRLNAIQARLVRPGSVDDIHAALAELDQLADTEPAPEGLEVLQERAVHCLRELTSTDPAGAANHLLQELLPRCLYGSTKHPRRSRYNQVFGDWLKELPEKQRIDVRSSALPAAIAALADDRILNGLRLIASIGYADAAVLQALDAMIVATDTDIGDFALSVRLWLSPSPDIQPRLRDELHRRMQQRRNLYLISAARKIGDSTTIDLLFQTYFPSRPDQPHDVLMDVGLGVLTTITERHQEQDLPTRTWQRLLALEPLAPKAVGTWLALHGGLAPAFDTPTVIPELVARACRAGERERYLLYMRLSECVRPAQMPGWDNVAINDFAAIHEDASRLTTMEGRFLTVEFKQKEEAWSVLMSLGRPSSLPSFEDAIDQEKNGYAINSLLALGACLALPRLPRIVAELLAGPPQGLGWSENEYTVAQVGAIEAAHGAASRQAFEVLLGYRPIGSGVLLSVIDALASIAGRLARTGDRELVQRLLAAAGGTADEHIRTAAAGALAILVEDGTIIATELIRVSRLTADPSTDPYARRDLLYALAERVPAQVGTELLDVARELTRPDQVEAAGEADVGLRQAALVFLARQADVSSESAFLVNRLGLRLHDATVDIDASLPHDGVRPFILGFLFEQYPGRFAPAVASLLRRGPPPTVAPLLVVVRRVGRSVPSAVVEALLDRVRVMDRGASSEPAVLEVLAEVSPGRLLSAAWPHLDGWLPQARSTFAAVLAQLGQLQGVEAKTRSDLLTRLAGDGLYGVRRASYRAMAECDPIHLKALLNSWASSQEPGGAGIRQRAAEGVGWLSGFPPDGLLAALAWDPEPTVRETLDRSLTERDERRWAAWHESHVLGVATESDVLHAWRYGVALGHVGDDRTLERLGERHQADLPPAVRFWLTRVERAVQRRWDAVGRKWPEPWFARRGQLETFTGLIRAEDGKEIEAQGTLWVAPGEEPNERHSWGGWGTAQLTGTGEYLLILARCPPARIVLTNVQLSDGTVVFGGSGPYPER